MSTVLRVITWILALNLAYALLVVLAELWLRWKARREVELLETLWRLDPRGAIRSDPRRRRVLERAVLASAAVFVLSGVAVASPVGDAVVSTVSGIVERLGDGSTIEAAPPDDDSGGGGGPSLVPAAPAPGSADPEPSARRDEPPDDRAEHGTERPQAESPPRASSPTAPAPPSDDGQTPEPSPDPVDPPTQEEPEFSVTVAATRPTSLDVTWTDVVSATAFGVDYSTDGAEWTEAARVPADVHTATIDGLDPGTTYQLRVTALFADGGARVATAVATTDVTAPPQFSGEEDAPVSP